MKILNILIFVGVLSVLSGCANDKTIIDNVKDTDMTAGCYVIDGGAAFDSYFKTTTGKAGVCKVKCSKTLPKNFTYSYQNTRTGCSIKVGG